MRAQLAGTQDTCAEAGGGTWCKSEEQAEGVSHALMLAFGPVLHPTQQSAQQLPMGPDVQPQLQLTSSGVRGSLQPAYARMPHLVLQHGCKSKQCKMLFHFVLQHGCNTLSRFLM